LEVSSARNPPYSATQSFPGKYNSLERIGLFVRQIAEEAGLEGFDIFAVEMAVDEACSNIIEHAYEGEGKGEIRCTCAVQVDKLTIVLQDQGKSFDPSIVPKPNLSKNLDEREAHGLGLYFIHQWMDEVYFTSTGLENTLTMVKNR
jgi:serine/threonine-protein kinase RsbW